MTHWNACALLLYLNQYILFKSSFLEVMKIFLKPYPQKPQTSMRLCHHEEIKPPHLTNFVENASCRWWESHNIRLIRNLFLRIFRSDQQHGNDWNSGAFFLTVNSFSFSFIQYPFSSSHTQEKAKESLNIVSNAFCLRSINQAIFSDW